MTNNNKKLLVKEDLVGFSKRVYNPIIRPQTEALLRKIIREKAQEFENVQKYQKEKIKTEQNVKLNIKHENGQNGQLIEQSTESKTKQKSKQEGFQEYNKGLKILEIGTFLGYSGAVMLQEDENTTLITLEKDEQNSIDAVQNLNNLGFSGRFEVVCCDAWNFLKQCDQKFDIIFLDGPKGQYYKYLPYLKELLNCGGVLVCDDILFHGYVQADGKIKHKHRTIVNNMRNFLNDLQNDPNFKTELYDFEDGVAVSYKT